MTPRKVGSSFHPFGKLTIVGSEPFSQLDWALRQSTISDPSIHPFCRAKIELVSVPIRELHPCATYVLKSGLANVLDTARQLKAFGVDVFNLLPDKAALFIKDSNDPDWIMKLIPPLVEVEDESMLIVDGLHRVSTAKLLDLETITVIRVSGSSVPYHSLPLEWADVRQLDVTPPDEEKRRHRFGSAKELLLWILKHPERFAQGFEELPRGVSPERWAGTYVWNSPVIQAMDPFEKMEWFHSAHCTSLPSGESS